MDDFLQQNLMNLWLLARSCGVVVARTDDAGPPPGIWSESEKAVQQVSVVVEETLCGQAPENPRLRLDLPIVRGTRIAAADPALAAWISDAGSRVVYFLENGQLADEDLGAFPADPELVEYLRQLCTGPMPTGIGPIFYQLSQLAEHDPALQASLTGLSPSVLDIMTNQQPSARVTIVATKIRVFTGIRLQRVINSRQPDVLLEATAGDVADALKGRRPIGELVVKGEAPELLTALERAAAVIARNPEHCAIIDRASGLPR